MPKKYFKLLRNSSFIFVASQILANLVNFSYNAYLGRQLKVEDFGLITLINTLFALVTIYVVAFGATVNHHSSFLTTQKNKLAALDFFGQTRRKLFTVSLLLTLIWLVSIPFLAKFFFIGDISSLLFFTPVVLLALFAGVNRSFLQSQLLLYFVAMLLFFESVAKLLSALVIVESGFDKYTYLSIPFSILFSFIVSGLLIKFKIKQPKITLPKINYSFPRRFFFSALVVGLSTSGFLTLDLVLVKHFLLPAKAGEYALLSLAGKMIFFFGSLVNGLIVTFVSRDLGQEKNPNDSFYKLLLVNIGLTIFAYLFVGLWGSTFVPLLLGPKTLAIVPYLNSYGLAISFFTISNAFVLYHLVRHHYTFSLMTLVSSLVMIGGISFYHQDIGQIVNVIFLVSAINIVAILGLHILKRDGKFILRNMIDLIDIFSKLPEQTSQNQKRILIFNWRDTKHKFAGGAEVYIHELAKRWVKEGYGVTIFCGNDGWSLRNEMVEGIRIVRRGGFYFVYVWAFFYYLFKFRGKVDVIIDCQNGIPFFTPLYAKEKIYCLMFHVHQEVFVRSLSKPLAIFAQNLENRMMPWAYRKTPFITISPSSRVEIQALDLGTAGIEIVYPGIDLKSYKKGIKSREPLVLYVGRLQFYKSVNVFLNSAAEILKQIPQTKFVVAGDGEEKEKLISQAQELGIEKKVSFLGKVSEKVKIDLYQKAWVFVNPSFKEGWGITSIEANACGTPVIASNVPGLKDSVLNPHTGFLVKYGDHDQFAKKIIYLINDQRLRESMSKQAIDWAGNFDWQQSAQKGLEIIASKTKRILEIGFGEGNNLNKLAKKEQNQVTGIEISLNAVRDAKKKFPHLELRQMNAEKLKFKNHQFDEVYAFEILEHVDNLEAVVEELNRVLVPGGKVTLSIPFEQSEHLLLKIRPTYFKEIHHVRIFKNNELEKIMKKYGFKLINKKRTGFLSHVNVIYQFLTSKKSNTQLEIGNWRGSFTSRMVFIGVSFFQPYILETPGKYFPIWVITLPIGFLLNYFGNKVFPKSIYYEFKKAYI